MRHDDPKLAAFFNSPAGREAQERAKELFRGFAVKGGDEANAAALQAATARAEAAEARARLVEAGVDDLDSQVAGLRARLAEMERREADWLAYVKLLVEDMRGMAGLAYAHGLRTSQALIDEGKRLRERLGLDDNNDPKAALVAGEREMENNHGR